MKKLAALFCVCLGVSNAQELPVFSLALDVPMLVAFAGVGIYGSHELRHTEAPATIKDKSELLPWDRPFAGTYSGSADFASDITNVSIVFPLAIAGFAYYENTVSGVEALGLVAMYVETMSLQAGVNLLVRSHQWWPRPYVYASGHEKEKDEGQAYASFYSGHVSAAFSAAVLTTYSFDKVYPNSKYFWHVAAGSFSLASATAILRIAAGKHYPSDVIAGAAIGSSISLAVIGVHELWGRHTQFVAFPGYAGVNVSF